MLKHKKSYKQPNKANRKVKVVMEESENGELSRVNAGHRKPVISLPEINTVPIFQCYRRFICTSAVSGSITIQDLLNQFGFAATSSVVYPYCQQVRIKKIRVLCPVTTQGTSVLVSMKPNTADTGNNCFNSVSETYIDTSASIDIPAYMHLTPSIKTPLGSWHYNSTVNANLLYVIFPSGSCCDILFEWIPSWSAFTAPAYTRTVAAATAGKTYAANILTNMVPQGLEVI